MIEEDHEQAIDRARQARIPAQRAWGRINATAGRDHWPDCYSVFLAGGGVRGGYVHGASDRIGAYPALDPVTPADFAATIFWRFGIDPATEIHDLTGRPYRLTDGEPIRHLFEGS